MIFKGVLGAMASVAALAPAADKHTATPASDQPYFTMWRMFKSDGLVEKFHNMKFVSANLSGSAGQLITVQVGTQGLKAERLVSEPVGGTLYRLRPHSGFRVLSITR